MTRAGDWLCLCGATNFATELNCAKCDGPQCKGTILDASNMRSRRKRKSKRQKEQIQIQKINGTIIQRLGSWSVKNPFGKNVPLDIGPKKWMSKLIQAAQKANGAHIHTSTSKWKFYELNLGTHNTPGIKYMPLSDKLR